MIRPLALDRGADLVALARVPANGPMLEYLRSHSGPRTERTASPWDIDGFELHSHPDLTERLDELGRAVAGARPYVGIHGYSALLDTSDWIRVVALGNAGIAIRLADGAVRGDIEANSRFRWTDLGGDWIGADPWPVDMPLLDGTARVRSWLAASFTEAAT